jgi:hypothetical protein
MNFSRSDNFHFDPLHMYCLYLMNGFSDKDASTMCYQVYGEETLNLFSASILLSTSKL